MARFEYKVVPAPTKGQKAKGVKTSEGRFALSVESLLNEMGAEGWEYLRAELLPSEERTGLTGSATNWRNVLVFRRALGKGSVSRAPIEAEDDDGATPWQVVGSGAPMMALAAGGGVTRAGSELGGAKGREGRTPPLFAKRPDLDEGDSAPAVSTTPAKPAARPIEPPSARPPEPEKPAEAEPATGMDADSETLTGIEKVVRRNAEEQAKKS
ncbi:DUF4177 domain-containing protein [Albibacillus kandeliae]|uniref:DUF4177 domain-containing protein n=1 Tax=Albibacillus kandeliae TaxID=2174228 RepID=UPI001E30DE1B|nr:DUF4177 domain-containing protein [Albibacillus kandeliae]